MGGGCSDRDCTQLGLRNAEQSACQRCLGKGVAHLRVAAQLNKEAQCGRAHGVVPRLREGDQRCCPFGRKDRLVAVAVGCEARHGDGEENGGSAPDAR